MPSKLRQVKPIIGVRAAAVKPNHFAMALIRTLNSARWRTLRKNPQKYFSVAVNTVPVSLYAMVRTRNCNQCSAVQRLP